jgi:hypothetical protein
MNTLFVGSELAYSNFLGYNSQYNESNTTHIDLNTDLEIFNYLQTLNSKEVTTVVTSTEVTMDSAMKMLIKNLLNIKVVDHFISMDESSSYGEIIKNDVMKGLALVKKGLRNGKHTHKRRAVLATA